MIVNKEIRGINGMEAVVLCYLMVDRGYGIEGTQETVWSEPPNWRDFLQLGTSDG
jgi:hypothetical protein